MRRGEYNGHHCWNCWNVALWIENDEGLYRLALDCKRRAKSARRAALAFLSESGMTRTPDGARMTVKAVAACIAGLE